jgi:succinate dehydrogenase / fumarate reductase membrane anchor subunit
MVKRVVTGAHYGLRDWLAQRVTATVMAVYALAFAAAMLVCAPRDYDAWRALFANQFVRAATFVFLVCLFWHAWIGVRDILMDYVKPTGVRLAMHVLAVLVLVGYAGWAIQILWSL